MLKIAVFDCGFGGERFADYLEDELPVVKVIRIIDRGDEKNYSYNRHDARRLAERAFAPYLGKVDLIIIANYFVATTSLEYFRRKYRAQKFIGFSLYLKRIRDKKPTLVVTTKDTTRSLAYLSFAHHFKAKTVCFDSWPLLIEQGELTNNELQNDLKTALARISDFSPKQILLACGQFAVLKPEFRAAFGHNVRIIDCFDETVDDARAILKLRGVRRKYK